MRADGVEVEVTSALLAERRTVLAHIATLDGVNRELHPILRMTAPRSYRERSLFEWPVGQPLFRSWLLLAGVLPVDFDQVALASLDPESGFEESSVMLAMSRWRHERRVTDCEPGGSLLVDRLTFSARVPGTGRLLARIVRLVFRHRHGRLRAMFGEAPHVA